MKSVFKQCEFYDNEHDCCKYYSDYGNEPVYEPCLEGPCVMDKLPKQDKL